MATDRKLPTQEEIEKDFQEFFQKKYGDGVNVRLGYVGGQQATSEQAEAEIPEPQKTFDLKFDLKPKDIKKYWIGMSSNRMRQRKHLPLLSVIITTMSESAMKILTLPIPIIPNRTLSCSVPRV